MADIILVYPQRFRDTVVLINCIRQGLEGNVQQDRRRIWLLYQLAHEIALLDSGLG